MKLRTVLSLSSALVALSPLAHGAITGTSGLCIQISPPFAAVPGALQASNAWAWDEQQNLFLAATMMDLSTNPSGSGSPVPGVIPAQFVDSHFIHFEGVTGTSAIGTVTFATQIIGVQYSGVLLDLTDAVAGTGTIYPTTLPVRGFSGLGYINIVANVLHFELFPATAPLDVEQVRVFTRAVPAPGAAALLGLGGLAALRRRR